MANVKVSTVPSLEEDRYSCINYQTRTSVNINNLGQCQYSFIKKQWWFYNVCINYQLTSSCDDICSSYVAVSQLGWALANPTKHYTLFLFYTQLTKINNIRAKDLNEREWSSVTMRKRLWKRKETKSCAVKYDFSLYLS